MFVSVVSGLLLSGCATSLEDMTDEQIEARKKRQEQKTRQVPKEARTFDPSQNVDPSVGDTRPPSP